MTQAAAVQNNYEVLNEALMADKTVSQPNTANFDEILDEKITTTEPLTIGDIKNETFDKDLSDKLTGFKEILSKTANEANMENALDLTLARDVNEIIDQIKGAVEISETNTDTIAENLTGQNVSTKEEDTDISDKVNGAFIFEQILTLINNFCKNPEGAVSELAESAINLTNDILKNENIEQELAENVSELLDQDAQADIEGSEISLDKDILRELNIESLEAETDANQGDNLMNKQSPEEYGVKVMLNNGAEKINVSFQNIQNQAIKAQGTDISPEKIIEQLTKQMDNLQKGGKVNIVLNPESLGKVNVQLINTKEGLSAQFTVATQEAREVIMKGLNGLKDILTAHGVGVDNISVKVNETEKESYNSDWTDQEGSRGGNKDDGQPNREEKEKGLFEKTIAKSFKQEKDKA